MSRLLTLFIFRTNAFRTCDEALHRAHQQSGILRHHAINVDRWVFTNAADQAFYALPPQRTPRTDMRDPSGLHPTSMAKTTGTCTSCLVAT